MYNACIFNPWVHLLALHLGMLLAYLYPHYALYRLDLQPWVRMTDVISCKRIITVNEKGLLKKKKNTTGIVQISGCCFTHFLHGYTPHAALELKWCVEMLLQNPISQTVPVSPLPASTLILLNNAEPETAPSPSRSLSYSHSIHARRWQQQHQAPLRCHQHANCMQMGLPVATV